MQNKSPRKKVPLRRQKIIAISQERGKKDFEAFLERIVLNAKSTG